MATQRFRVMKRPLVGFFVLASLAAIGVAVFGLAAGEPWWFAAVFSLQAVSFGLTAFAFGRHTIDVTDAGIVATSGFERRRVAWYEIERVQLDWAAEAAGRDGDVLRIERKAAEPITSSAAMGMGGSSRTTQAVDLEAALKERAQAHGFTVEVTWPSWMA